MKCLKCGKECKAIVARHLASCSGITVSQYLEEFPNAVLVDPEIKLKFGLPKEKNPNYKHGRCFTDVFCDNCHTKLRVGSKGGYCRHCYAKFNTNHFLGKTHTEATKQRLVESAKTRDKSTYNGGPGNRTHEEMSDTAKKVWANETKEDRLKRLSNWIHAGQTSRRSSLTSIEIKIGELIPDNFNVKKSHKVLNYYVDLLINDKFIVECYGDYWHCNPNIYDGAFYNKSLKLLASQKWVKDAERIYKLENAGYKVLVLWEADIKLNLDKVKNTLEKFLYEDV